LNFFSPVAKFGWCCIL